jgi:hypothetical protein
MELKRNEVVVLHLLEVSYFSFAAVSGLWAEKPVSEKDNIQKVSTKRCSQRSLVDSHIQL